MFAGTLLDRVNTLLSIAGVVAGTGGDEQFLLHLVIPYSACRRNFLLIRKFSYLQKVQSLGPKPPILE